MKRKKKRAKSKAKATKISLLLRMLRLKPLIEQSLKHKAEITKLKSRLTKINNRLGENIVAWNGNLEHFTERYDETQRRLDNANTVLDSHSERMNALEHRPTMRDTMRDYDKKLVYLAGELDDIRNKLREKPVPKRNSKKKSSST